MFRCRVQSARESRAGFVFRQLKSASRCVVAASVLCILAGTGAQALECAAIIVDRGDEFSFGQARLGDPPSRLPAGAVKPQDCASPCEYTDGNGVSYFVEGQEIVRKEIRDVSQYRGSLPVHMSATDPLTVILSRLGSFTEGTPIWSLTPLPGGSVQLATDACIEGSNGVRGAYGFVFDRQGRLTSISTRSP